MKKELTTLYIASLFALFSCSSEKNNTSKVSNSDTIISEVVENWNSVHNPENISKIETLYAENVDYYGSAYSKKECVESKIKFIAKNPEYYQQIVGQIDKVYDPLDSNQVTCKFIKRVVFKGKTTDYPSYLVLQKTIEQWKIIQESDLVTDKNLSKKSNSKVPKDAVKGDFDGDGKTEYAWLIPPNMSADDNSCVGACTGYIVFSNKRLNRITVNDCIGGSPDNLGDLNQDGKDEIGILPSWFTSCWRGYYVWSFGKNGWYQPVEPITTHCDQWDQGIRPIETDWQDAKNVIIRYSEHTGEEIIVKSKTVLFRNR